MRTRLLSLHKKHSLLLLGPRNTGKSTLLRHLYPKAHSLYIDLLDIHSEERFSNNPGELANIVKALPKNITHVIIDEIQKIPKLLDVIHVLIEKTNTCFVMSGSSARKLKKGASNLLAGRAFVYHLYPFTFLEVQDVFNTDNALHFGMLPKIFEYKTTEEKILFLQAYAHTYLKEEIWAEHFIRELDPFRRFLEVAAQMNGKVINVSKIAKDVGVDDKTVSQYYSILEDTLLGFYLNGFQHSFRKRLGTKPKFYFFDTGVVRALTRMLSVPLVPKTSAYGEAFEHFIILECIKLSAYYYTEYKFTYVQTKDDAEIDLVVERPGQKTLFIEIKSSDNVTQDAISSFIRLVKDLPEGEYICLSNDPYEKMLDTIWVLPWQEGIKRFFTKNVIH